MTKRGTSGQRCAIYARTSTSVGQSPQMQLDCLREYAERRGLVITDEFTFIDHGHSGAKERRPGLDALMDAARKRKVDTVLCYRFDRIARSTSHLLRVLEEFNSLGVAFVSYAENLSTDTPIGKAMFTIIGALADYAERAVM